MPNDVAVRTCCGDRRNWKDKTDKTRPTWIRTECTVCGRFMGYRPRQVEAAPAGELLNKPKRTRKAKAK